MKTLLIFTVALALLVGACGVAEPVNIDETTTTEYMTTEVETVIFPFVAAQGHVNGVAWQTIDPTIVDAEFHHWLGQQAQEAWQTLRQRVVFGEQTHGVFVRGELPRQREIYRVNPDTAEETVLLRGSCILPVPHTFEQAELCGNECVEGPRYIMTLDEQFFIYKRFRAVPGIDAAPPPLGYGVFDLYNMQAHFVELDRPWVRPAMQRNGVLFWESGSYDALSDFQNPLMPLRLYAMQLGRMPQLDFSQDLLAGIAHMPVQNVRHSLLTQDQRFYAVVCEAGLTLFDLQERKALQLQAAQLPEFGATPEYVFERDTNTLIWTTDPFRHGNQAMIQITLP